ncbi:MAG TPA: SDR family oxidoreductase [Syntrophales bacterium]|nr:SDR family oxidoreductase [Syntrophales bacterium]
MDYLVTGGAGFIGSNVAEALLKQGCRVRVLDNFLTGKRDNLTFAKPGEVELIEGDIRDLATCRRAVEKVDYVIHLAALGSVPRSVADPLMANEINVTGTLNVLVASRDAGVKRLVYASSSSVYGDQPTDGQPDSAGGPTPKVETMTPNPLSPYAVNKLAGEAYCRVFYRLYGMETVALRYFNVFGMRQDPASEYAAVIPRFISALLEGRQPVVYGDGKQSRDFTFVEDVVSATLLACTAPVEAAGRVFNIACNRRFTLLELLAELKEILGSATEPVFAEARKGDIRHSMADIALAKKYLRFEPRVSFRRGLERTVDWFRSRPYNPIPSSSPTRSS